MSKIREKTDLDKKPIWYLFLLANVIVVIGCAITFALFYRSSFPQNINLLALPTIICNVVAVIPAGFFIWLEMRDISPKLMHFQKKWLKFYIVAASFFVLAICFNALFYVIATKNAEVMKPASSLKWIWIIYLVLTAVFTLVSIGFQRYARYRIDLDVYRRKHGEEIKGSITDSEDKKTEEVKPEDNSKKEETSSEETKIDAPTGGLIDQMDK